jgi:prepilin-type N-terminal cleavage/methylation domain-containing protein
MRRFRVPDERGFTLIEVLISSVILVIGIFGTFTLVSMANAGANRARAREGATNLAREVLEDAHAITYSKVGGTAWITSAFNGLSGRTGSVTTPATNSIQTLVARRGVSYTVTTSWCSVDDSKDGYGAHAVGTTWCSDSATTNTADAQPEDFKRVITDVTYTTRGVQQPTVEQVATFGAGGAAVGPTVSNLQITTPTGLSQTAPIITANPTPSPPGNAVFVATASGAADVKFTVNGVQVASGVVNNNNGTWTLSWPISSLTDATYTVGATAVDALGVSGQPLTKPVKLVRGAPPTSSNIVGGYNYVWVSGVKTLVVEGQWDANPSGSVTGYEVLRGGTTICGGPTNLAISCIDLNAPSSGTTTYTYKTWYKDAAGASQSVSATYNLTAPTPPTTVATLYGYVGTTSQVGFTPGCGTSGSGLGVLTPKRDIVANFPTSGGSDSTATGSPPGCGPQLPAGTSLPAGTATFSAWMTNTNNKSCTVTWFLYHNNTNFGNAGAMTVPAGTSTPTKFTSTATYTAQTIAANDTLNMYVNTCASGAMYFGSGAHQTTLSLPTLSGGSAGTTIAAPSVPTGLSGVHDSTAATNTLTWTAPATSTTPVDFYRIYRDGTNYTNRIDTTDASASTLSAGSAVNATSVTATDASTFAVGQVVSVDTGGNQDNVTISSISGNTITFTGALAHAHASGVPVSLRTVTWTDTNLGGTTHTYYVTAASAFLAESNPFVGPTAAL